MGWTDLFKPKKSVDLKPDPRIRWFGKLPTYADYYTSPTDAEWATEFNDWVMKGYEVYHAREQARVSQGDGGSRSASDRLPLAGAVLRLPKSGMTAFATIQDYGGDMRGRHFPICFYVGFPTGGWPAPESGGIAPALDTVDALMKLRDDVDAHFRAPGRFDSRFGERDLDLSGFADSRSDESWRRGARTIPMADWFNVVRPVLKIDELGPWCSAVHKWGQGISAHDADGFEPTFRFPLALSFSINAQVAGWMRWLERRMNLKKRFLSMTFATDGKEGVGYFSVIARPPVPEDFILITSQASSLAYLDDLVGLNGSGDTNNHGDAVPASFDAFSEQG